MKKVTDILGHGAETYERKNADYGESWRNIGHILFQLANEQPVVLASPEDWIAAGLFTRRMDKIARSFNGEFLAEEMNFESASDADEDESVYAAMQAANKHDRHAAEGYRRAATDGGQSPEETYNNAWAEVFEENE